MDLRTGCTFWPQLDADVEAAHPPLAGNIACDVLVIGGGVSGALAAHYLVEAGVNTALIDRRDVARGSTAASTGLLQYEIDTPLTELARKVGAADARRAYRLCVECLDRFRELVAELGDDCGLTPRPSLYLASGPGHVPGLREECDARRACGIEVDFLDQSDLAALFPFSRPAALWSHRALEVDPYRLTQRLIERAIGRGVRCFGGTEAALYESDGEGVTVRTAGGPEVRARRVVFATGYETPQFLDRRVCELKSTYAAVGEPGADFAGWHDRCLIWETARPYFYARTTRDGRAMVGGEDEDFADPESRDRLIPQKARLLAGRFGELFPHLGMTPACTWAGTFAQTKDGLPYIGSVPQFPNGYFALGYGGNGITFSLIAAGIIRDLFLGVRNPDVALFRFGR